MHEHRVTITVADGQVTVSNVDTAAEAALALFRGERPSPAVARIMAVTDAVRLGLLHVSEAPALSRALSRTDPDDPMHWDRLPGTPPIMWCLNQYLSRSGASVPLPSMWEDAVAAFPADAPPERAATFLSVAAEQTPDRALGHPAAPAELAVAYAGRGEMHAAAGCPACPPETLTLIWTVCTAELVSERPAGWRSIIERVAAHPNVERDVVWQAADLWDWSVDRAIASNATVEPDLLERIAERHVDDAEFNADPSRSLVALLARHPSTPARVLHRIVDRTWSGIAVLAARNPSADRLVLEAIVKKFPVGWIEGADADSVGGAVDWSPVVAALAHPAADDSLTGMVHGEGRARVLTGEVEFSFHPERGVELGEVAVWRLGFAELLGDRRAVRLRGLLGCVGRGDVPVHSVRSLLAGSCQTDEP